MNTALDLAEALGHEEVAVVRDPEVGLRAVIAIHDTTLGPAAGGTRMRPYPRFEDAVIDALRLSRAMTYKAVMAGVKRGGAKAVIAGDPGRDKTRSLLVSYAKIVDRFGGRFHTGCDMGVDGRDVAVMARATRHISHSRPGSSLDVATLTALGVVSAIRAVARELETSLPELHIAVQGLGQVGERLARRLVPLGAKLTVTDVNPGRVERLRAELDVEAVAPDAIYDVEADVFSPNAAGSVLSAETLPRLRCRAVAGAANDQLADRESGDALYQRGVLYAPDYVVNAGGLLSLLWELGETDEDGVVERTEQIGPRVAELIERSRAEAVPTHRLADRIVEERLAAARDSRREARRPRSPAGGDWAGPE